MGLKNDDLNFILQLTATFISSSIHFCTYKVNYCKWSGFPCAAQNAPHESPEILSGAMRKFEKIRQNYTELDRQNWIKLD